MKVTRRAAFLAAATWAGVLEAQTVAQAVPLAPERPDTGARYLFYLHGRILEDQGIHAVSPEHGRYEYAAILARLAAEGFAVISEIRAADTDPHVYADSVIRQVRRLLGSGVAPTRISVIGASKGAVIAMLVSSRLTAGIRYVLMANCNDYILNAFEVSMHGDVLSIFEGSDPLGQTCRAFFERSPGLGEREEVRLETGLSHGFIFRPLEVWVAPASRWARR
jgi:hypothetical protein